jgi:hypothetical protein
LENISSYQKLKRKIDEIELKYINDIELLVNGTNSEKFLFSQIYNRRKNLKREFESHIWFGSSEPTTVEKMQIIMDGMPINKTKNDERRNKQCSRRTLCALAKR